MEDEARVTQAIRLSASLPFLCFGLGSLAGGQDGTEPYVVEPDVGQVAAPDRRTAEPGIAIPTAPAKHAVQARSQASGISHTPARIGSIPIQTPLPHVPVHVIQSPSVGLLQPHWLTRTTTV